MIMCMSYMKTGGITMFCFVIPGCMRYSNDLVFNANHIAANVTPKA